MEPVFHTDLKVLTNVAPFILELGCGPHHDPSRIGIDRLDLPGVDIVADLEEGLPFIPDNCVDEIHSKSFLEHVEQLDRLMREIWRVLKPEGKKHLFVPHFSNPYYYSDYTHRRFFGLYSFDYFGDGQSRFQRRVPSFYHDFVFRVEDICLDFRTPFRSRRFAKRVAMKLFNASPWWQEFYEENLCFLLPCYGIQATLSAVK
jgi:ubiquinone/menaquinone biosynthesis C-methylase UbiE